MGLIVETIKDMFNFALKYPKSFLFSFIINILVFIGALVMVGGALVSLGPALKTAVQSSSFPGFSTFLLTNMPGTAGTAVFSIIGFIIILIASLIRSGGFPILVYRAARRRKADLASVFQITFRKLSKIFIANVLLGIIVLVPLIPVFLLALSTLTPPVLSIFSSTSFITLAIVGLAFVAVAVFLGIKLWLTIPILMIENRGPMDSLKASWQRTKGHFLSIIGVSILYALVVGLPLSVIDTLFKLGGVLVYLIWALTEGIITTTLSGILSTIYYFNMKNIRRR
jgi:membrane-anchored glycerophosphoryl diester phosphodiesterase (GDPDase)